jgi:hypothetical protein
MNDEENPTPYIEQRLREAIDHFAQFKREGADMGLAPLADGLILMADSLRVLALQVDKIRAKIDEGSA